MSLAALGCNPNQSGPSLEDIGGVTLGTLAFSPDGGLYVAVQAGQVISPYACAAISGDWELRAMDLSDDANLSMAICFPQVRIENDAYGWGLVFGNGFGIAAAAIAAGAILYPHNTEGRISSTAAALHLNGVHARAAQGSAGSPVSIAVQWPSVDLIA